MASIGRGGAPRLAENGRSEVNERSPGMKWAGEHSPTKGGKREKNGRGEGEKGEGEKRGEREKEEENERGKDEKCNRPVLLCFSLVIYPNTL